MGHSRLRGTLVFRIWHESEGYTEDERSFETLEELFHLCMQQTQGNSPLHIDRIVLRGSDEQGDERTAVFTFQSITAGDGAPLA